MTSSKKSGNPGGAGFPQKEYGAHDAQEGTVLLLGGQLFFGYAFGVFAGTGIDFYQVALIDEEGDLNFITVIDFSRFGNVGCSIAANSGFGFDDFFFDKGRESDFDGFAVEEDEFAGGFFDEEVDIIAEELGRNLHFFIGIGIAENVIVTVVVGVEKFTLFQVGFFDFIGGTVSFFHTCAGNEVFHFAAVECCAFAGFAEVKFGDDPRLTVDLDFQSFSQIGCAEHSLNLL